MNTEVHPDIAEQIDRGVALLKQCQSMQSEKDGVERGDPERFTTHADPFAQDIARAVGHMNSVRLLLPMLLRLSTLGYKLRDEGAITVDFGGSFADAALDHLMQVHGLEPKGGGPARQPAAAADASPTKVTEPLDLPRAVERLLSAMDMQEKRERGEFHIAQPSAAAIWNEAKGYAEATLAAAKLRQPVAYADPAELESLAATAARRSDGSTSAQVYAGPWAKNLVPLYLGLPQGSARPRRGADSDAEPQEWWRTAPISCPKCGNAADDGFHSALLGTEAALSCEECDHVFIPQAPAAPWLVAAMRDLIVQIDIKAEAGQCQFSGSGKHAFLGDIRGITTDALGPGGVFQHVISREGERDVREAQYKSLCALLRVAVPVAAQNHG